MAALNLQIALGNTIIFTIQILPIQGHGISVCLFVLSLISTLQFSEQRPFVSFGRFIPRNFILFVVMINGIVLLISLCDLPLLVYRNAKLCINIISYNFTKLSDQLQHFYRVMLGFLCIMASVNSGSFTSFPIQISLFHFLLSLPLLGLSK